MTLPNLAQQSSDLSKLDLLYRLQNLMNAYVITNMLLAGTAPQSEIITFINPNLYQLAVKYYGDTNYWTVIAHANQLSAPFYAGTISLLIPPKPSNNTGGILYYG